MGLLNILSLLGVFATTQLPAGYTRVEYLYATGTQYIDTLWIPKSDYKLTVDVDLLNTGNQCIYGRKGSSPRISDFGMVFSGNMLMGYNASSEAYYESSVLLGRQLITINNKKAYRDNEELVLCGPPSEDWSLPLSYYLFARAQGSAGYRATAKIHYFKADDGITACELIPCLDDNGRPCMYDLIRKITLYNQGTGEFIAGPPIL